MGEAAFGPLILAEARAMYQVMLGGKTNYGQQELVALVERHLYSLADTPIFRAEVKLLMARLSGWGRRVFINLLYDLIAGYFKIDAPHDLAPVSPWVAAPEPETEPVIVLVHDILDLDLDNLDVVSPPRTPDSPPWG